MLHMLEKLLNKIGYVKKDSKWNELLNIEAPFVDSLEFRASCAMVVVEPAFEKGIKWIITETLKKIMEKEEMMSKEEYQLLMASVLTTDNVLKQFKVWASQVPDKDEPEFDEHTVI